MLSLLPTILLLIFSAFLVHLIFSFVPVLFKEEVTCVGVSDFTCDLIGSHFVQSKISFLAGPQATAKREELTWFRYVTRHDSLTKIMVQGILKGGRRRGRQKKNTGRITSKNGCPCPRQNCSQRPPAGKTGRGSLLNLLSCSSDDPIV